MAIKVKVKVKFSLFTPWRHIVGAESQIHSFLPSALDRVQWLALCPGQLNPGEGAPVPIEQEVGWALEWIWTFLEKRKSLAPTRIRIPDSLGCSLASILTRLSWLPIYCYEKSHVWLWDVTLILFWGTEITPLRQPQMFFSLATERLKVVKFHSRCI
jgi:hypothetical protein